VKISILENICINFDGLNYYVKHRQMIFIVSHKIPPIFVISDVNGFLRKFRLRLYLNGILSYFCNNEIFLFF
jgi:hypothetical protein